MIDSLHVAIRRTGPIAIIPPICDISSNLECTENILQICQRLLGTDRLGVCGGVGGGGLLTPLYKT